MQDFLTQLPQNFAGGLGAVTQVQGNNSGGLGIDLRGLGPGTTLTLVEGRRQTNSGDTSFFDVSSLPVAAVERVEILTDGASAIYGSDAIGGVVNFILRRDFNGAETLVEKGFADGVEEERVSQLLGYASARSSLLFGYQYYHRDALAAADRSFAASADKTPFGGDDFRAIGGNPGTLFAGGNIYAIPSGQDGTALIPADFTPGTLNFGDQNRTLDLLPENTSHNAFLNGTLRIHDQLEIFASARYAERTFRGNFSSISFTLPVFSSNAFYVNPAGGSDPVLVAYDYSEDIGPPGFDGETQSWSADLGFNWDVGDTWRITAFGSHGFREEHTAILGQIDFANIFGFLADPDPNTALNLFGDSSNTNPATLAAITSDDTINTESEVTQFNFVADGELFTLPAGTARLAIGADYLESSLLSRRLPDSEITRDVAAAFAELAAPLLARQSGDPLVAINLAARYDSYSDFGDTFNPRFGIAFTPTDALTLRGTWGTSFRAPDLIDLAPNALGSGVFVLDYPSPVPAGSETVLYRTGSNADLGPEEAEVFTLGFDLRPPTLEDFVLNVTYYHIEYTDRIITPGDGGRLLFDEPLWAGFVDRSPDPAELAALCAIAAGDCAATPPVAILDDRRSNAAALSTSGIDLRVSQSWDLGAGRLSVALNTNVILEYEQQVTASAPTIDLLDSLGNPTSVRTRLQGAYETGPWSFTTALNYTGGYDDSVLGTGREIDAWTTLDAGLAYRVQAESGPLAGVSVALRSTNVFDEDPPFVNSNLGYDAANATPLGRLVSIEATKRW